MAMRLGRIIRCYGNTFSLPAKTLCAERFPVAARSYSSGPEFSQAFELGEILAVGGFLAWLTCRLDLGGIRTKNDSYMSKDHRTKIESAKAELEMIQRKISAIRAKQYKRDSEDCVTQGDLRAKPTG